MQKLKVTICGAAGYTGIELIKILLNHPYVVIINITSRQYEGRLLSEVFPYFFKKTDLRFGKLDFANSDIIFLCLPAEESIQIVPQIKDKIIIDLSGAYRLKDSEEYPKWYKFEHPDKTRLKEAVYGLPEIYRDNIRNAKLIANPGCYATAVLLSIIPAIKAGIVSEDIIIDAKSGISGRGRKLEVESLFTERSENIQAYKITDHQHIPEIQQAVLNFLHKQINLVFVPHLIPVIRGIFITAYLKLTKKLQLNAVFELYKNFYSNAHFIRILENTIPDTKSVLYTNFCDIGFAINNQNNMLIVISTIDNLMKGAASQAVQNMNIACGFEETCGII